MGEAQPERRQLCLPRPLCGPLRLVTRRATPPRPAWPPLPQFYTLFVRAVRVRRFETLSRQDLIQFIVVGAICGMIWWQARRAWGSRGRMQGRRGAAAGGASQGSVQRGNIHSLGCHLRSVIAGRPGPDPVRRAERPRPAVL